MSQYTAQSVLEKPAIFHSLIQSLGDIPDQRSDQGKRFDLAYLIGLVIFGLIKGKVSIEACVEFGCSRKRWFSRWFDTTHGVPDATTISRALAVTPASDVIRAVNRFTEIVDDVSIEMGVSIDGKTVKAISELKKGCRHFISIFSHTTCHILDQEGVVSKENEITATPRLLSRQFLPGTMITADALLTQTKITKAIRKSEADYLLAVKGNHSYLEDVFRTTFADPLTKVTRETFTEGRKTRDVSTTISLTSDLDLAELQDQGWCDLTLVGKLHRVGKRTTKRTGVNVDETIFFITSREGLTPNQAYQFLRNHWHIENKLHWQKDVTWREDRQRTRTGHAPGVLSYLRSFALQCVRTKYDSVTRAIESFTERPQTYLNLLTQLQLV